MSKAHHEYKSFAFNVSSCKQIDREGLPVGIIEGYASTWSEDRVGDIIQKGAFTASLQDHKNRGNRFIRFLAQHNNNELIGGFPINMAREDEKGLFVVGEINLNVQRGAEMYSLAKQGVLTDLSVGITVDEFEIESNKRIIKVATLFEISAVSEPANKEARIQAVKKLQLEKSATPFLDLPLADEDMEWDSDAAIGRVREFTDSIDGPSDQYRDAFFWYDRENKDEFGSYKLPFIDVVDGEIKAVPRGIFAAAGALEGARGGVDIPGEDRPSVVAHVDRYYQKMGIDSPFEESDFKSDQSIFISIEMLKKNHGRVGLEKLLKSTGVFSRGAAALISSCLSGNIFQSDQQECQRKSDYLSDIKNIKNAAREIELYAINQNLKQISKKLGT